MSNLFAAGNQRARIKLSNEQVRDIKNFHHSGEWTYGTLAKKYGVASETIARIVRGESRANIVTEAELREQQAIADIETTREVMGQLERLRTMLGLPANLTELGKEVVTIAPWLKEETPAVFISTFPVSEETSARAAEFGCRPRKTVQPLESYGGTVKDIEERAGPGEDEPLTGLEKLQKDAGELKKSDFMLEELGKDFETVK